MITPIETELTTALTDLLLAIIVYFYAMKLNTVTESKLARVECWRFIFLLTATASLLGAIAHGLVLSPWVSQKYERSS